MPGETDAHRSGTNPGRRGVSGEVRVAACENRKPSLRGLPSSRKNLGQPASPERLRKGRDGPLPDYGAPATTEVMRR